MQLIETKESQNYLDLAKSLAKEFAETAVARDAKGGTPKHERDRLRQSNLLKLIVPTEYGGLGQSWITVLQITREFAKVDSSIAHVFSYHHLGVVIPHIFGSTEQKQSYYSETIRNNWFWCNALNPLDKRTTLTPDITNRIFEVMGARATSAKYGFDRYWRNLRTFTLHDPVDYKVRDIGNWALNDKLPKPDFYS
ncbi:acyl-CoA dehydrogenase family protein [Nostoc sp. JL33]|uniref:acyl-CoA dehydrogenase family protein n=1 Tax=Nostoc sp. JL33 TaxID=2815396 RepID=UPI0025E6DDDD|nr:acyl-CoA dehydrogenase family protein [Nostoc sp. JL33]MBN3870224.1 acyl-CoA dehydrogenase family protein [Nostoc sp. JL33]